MRRVKKTYKTVLVDMKQDHGILYLYTDSEKAKKIKTLCKGKSIQALGDIFKEGAHWMRVTVRGRKEGKGKRRPRGKDLYFVRRPVDGRYELGYGTPELPESIGFISDNWLCNFSEKNMINLFGLLLQKGEYIPVSIYAQHVNKPAQPTKNA